MDFLKINNASFYYRRLNAVQFDVRYMELNARKFNEPKSQIVKSAQILTDALFTYIRYVRSFSKIYEFILKGINLHCMNVLQYCGLKTFKDVI